MPSSILLSAGIPDRPIVLYGNKLLKKAAEHGYALQEVRDLSYYIQRPIAIFRGSHNGSIAILTEMMIHGKNTLVSIDIQKGEVQDFNLITSVFWKNNKGIIDWINNNKLLYVDKEKVLNYLSTSAPIADATNNAELDSAAKVIKDFENPNISAEKTQNPTTDRDNLRRASGERVVQLLQKAGIEVETISEAEAEGKYIGEQRMKQMHNAGGVLYGFTDGKKMVLIAERMNPNTPIHEYTHMWVEAYRQEHPKAWRDALELLKQTDEWYAVLNDPNYKDIAGDEQKVASEVLARLTADYFSADTGKGKIRFDLLANNGLRVRVANAVKRFWDTVLGWFGVKVNKPNQLQELINRLVEDLLRSREPSKFDEKYKKINETLDKGGRNVLSLQEISELTDALQDDIRQGIKPLVFERVPFEALQGLLGGQRTLAETLAIVARRSRRQSRAMERNGREITSEEILSRDGSNTQMELDLREYARERGVWIDNPNARTGNSSFFLSQIKMGWQPFPLFRCSYYYCFRRLFISVR